MSWRHCRSLLLKIIFLIWLITLGLGKSVQAEIDARYSIEGENRDRLVFDTSGWPNEHPNRWLKENDKELLRMYLEEFQGIEILEINNYGGNLQLAKEISYLVEKYELDTHTSSVCVSACMVIYLAGKRRSIDKSAFLGFHQLKGKASDLEAQYNEQKDSYGWKTPFEYHEYYIDTVQEHMAWWQNYLLDRGVDPRFIIKAFQNNSDFMWFPDQIDLYKNGVVTEPLN